MKTRKGFVTNSSSSSFVCCISGHTEEGWDLSLEEAEMYECENGHVFCESYLVQEPTDEDILQAVKTHRWYGEKIDKVFDELEQIESQETISDSDKAIRDAKIQNLKDEIDNYVAEFKDDEMRYELPACCCPVCQFKEADAFELTKFHFAKLGKEAVLNAMKQACGGDYKKLQEMINPAQPS